MISLAYITLNEEKYIERSILSVKNIVSEIIVLDAFSIDRTVEICQKNGAVVYQEKWKHDFSYARNLLLSKCSNPWVLTLDADEHLEGESLRYIPHVVQNCSPDGEICAWEFMRKNHYPSHDSDSPYFGPPFFPDFQIRLFKRISEIFYTGKVHEGLYQSIDMANKDGRNIGYVGRIPICIHHHMFRGDRDKFEKSKGKYYSDIEKGEVHAE